MVQILGIATGGSAALAVSAAVPAVADPSAISSALDRFQTTCATALTDPDTYIGTLAIPGPAGEEVLYTSDDGKYLLVHTAQSEGLTDYVEFAGLPDRTIRRCAISAVIPDFPEASEITGLLKPLLDTHATDVVGGQTRQVAPMWEPGDEAFAFEGDPWFVFHATGLLDGIDTVSTITVQLGGIRLAAEHTLRGGEVSQ